MPPSFAPATTRFASHALGLTFEQVAPEAIDQAKIYLLDTLGVGIAGSTSTAAAEAFGAATSWGAGAEARVWDRS